jgi:NAD(P)-dependent dehydrogenase (short-subunit alcohol dehydrogenase family)
MKIQNNTFLITGGASGLGYATAAAIIAQGGNVVIIDLNEDAGANGANSLGHRAQFVKANVCSEADIQEAVRMSLQTFGRIDGIINCAGVGPAKRVVGREGAHPLAFFQKVIDVNLSGTFNCIRLVAEQMQHNAPNDAGERGIVINTASVAAFDGQIGQAAYAASKGGILAMTLPIAREFAKMGIRVMTIAPGIFETPLLASLPQEAQDSLGLQVPFPPRLGKPSEFAQLAIQIIENQMLNGEVIRLDGAIRMGAK